MDAAPIFKQQPQLAGSARISAPLSTALLLLLLLTSVRLFDTVDIDVAWQLWIAGRLNSGARIYRDIIEVNPPLWFWMAQPIDALSWLTGTRPEHLLIITMGGLAALSLTAFNRLLPPVALHRRTILLAYTAIALVAIPWVHVGQREQIVLIGTLPYAALIAARRDRRHVPIGLAALVGLGAGFGFALKHYFVVVPAALELWLFAGKRHDFRLFRPETAALATAAAIYFIAIGIFARDYLSNVVPLILLAYSKVGASSMAQVLGPFVVLGLGIFAFTAAHWRLLSRAPLASALLVASASFGLAYFLQSKGWVYHAIPLVSCSSMALAALLAETADAPRLLRLLSPALLTLPAVFELQEQRHPAEPTPELVKAISDLQPGDTVAFLTVDNAIPWSVTLQRRFRYPTRYMSFWMLNAIVENEHLGNRDPRLAKLGRRIVTETSDDFLCMPPKAIIVARPGPGQRGFDILAFFERNPNFREVIGHYRPRPWTGLQRFDRISPLRQPERTCRKGI